MGVDILEISRGLGLGLVVLLILSLAYAAILNRLATTRGPGFFLPGLAVGTVGVLAWSVALLYFRAASAGVQVGDGGLGRSVGWALAPGMAGAWFACRSVLRRLRRGSPASLLRPAGGFWGGLGLVGLVLLIGDLYRLMDS